MILTELGKQIFNTGVDLGMMAAQSYINREDPSLCPDWVQKLPYETEAFIDAYFQGLKIIGRDKNLTEDGFQLGFMVTYQLMKKLDLKTIGEVADNVWLFKELESCINEKET